MLSKGYFELLMLLCKAIFQKKYVLRISSSLADYLFYTSIKFSPFAWLSKVAIRHAALVIVDNREFQKVIRERLGTNCECIVYGGGCGTSHTSFDQVLRQNDPCLPMSVL